MKKWKTIDSALVCSSNFLSIFNDKVVLPNGKKITFTKIELRDFVSVLPIIDDRIVMIEILRYPQNRMSLEIPSGHIENGETPKESAIRELKEETGYSSEKIIPLGCYNPLSRSTQRAFLFLAKDLKKGTQTLEITEQINVKYVHINEILTILADGKVIYEEGKWKI